MKQSIPSRSLRLASLLTTVSGIALLSMLAFVADGRGRVSGGDSRAMAELGPFPICGVAASNAGPIRLVAAGSEPTVFLTSPPPLWDGLGTLTYKITTSSAEAQKYFDQGLRLAYAFNHEEAQRAFREAQRLDPQCAMCVWGEAWVLGPNINAQMWDGGPAFAAATRAQALADRASARERALIAAMAKRYRKDGRADRTDLDQAYSAAMREVAAQFPDDDEIAVLYAEALMNVSPWNYWQPDGKLARPHAAEIVPTLERVLARNPDHPGAMHYYVHAVEASDRPARAAPHADRLRTAMPAAGHLIHMPSHIYFRIGRYRDSRDVNAAAAAADEVYRDTRNAPPNSYLLGYYPHNLHFLLAAAQMTGDGGTGITAAEKLASIYRGGNDHPSLDHIRAAMYFVHARFSPLDTVLAVADPGKFSAYRKAMWHYMRGVAFVTRGDVGAAQVEASAISTIDRSGRMRDGFTRQLLQIGQHVLEGRIAQAQGNLAAAVASFEKAAALQDGFPNMELPYWYFPVRQSVGAAMLQAGRLDEAEKQFQLALQQTPHSPWVYYGLAELARARGDAAAAQNAEAALARNWLGDRRLLTLSNL
jgi:tetratricopeptide (TPR) repeat protein